MTGEGPQPRGPGAGSILNLGIIAIGLLAITGLLVADFVSGEDPSTDEPLALAIALEPVAEGLDSPVLLTGSADGSGDRFVVEQGGRILRLLDDGSIDEEAFLDIAEHVLRDEGRGLLGLAFHPDYAENGRLFVAYSRRTDGATTISEFTAPRAGATGSTPVATTERALLTVPQPLDMRTTGTHAAGMLAFDHDGMLLVSMSDGGAADDPAGHGQDRASLLGKLLRLDVDRGWPYASPPDNGFADDPAAKPELHAIGLRDAWRFSVDRETGDLYIADAGQAEWEEVNVLPRGARRASFGWSEMEGPDCVTGRDCQADTHILPVVAYRRGDDGEAPCGVIGGFAYRGVAGSLPAGTYLYADRCSRAIWAVPATQLLAGRAQPAIVGEVPSGLGRPVSFGQDDAGELYLLTSAGHVLAISAAGPA
ncbi:MAG TPA: PQQ-dependent sugar dehydrogenase [Anaerolineae bacterium]|nr:PQQ-dependent sugar dehydrogenase [Anaerolineae bacterium]